MAAARLIRKRYPTETFVEAALAAPAFAYHGDKKYVTNLTVEVESLPVVDLAMIGYARADQKLAQLRRHYLNDADLTRVAALIRDRRQVVSSACLSMRGASKTREGSQGWCMEAVSFAWTNRAMTATVFYRQTELIFKFAADLVLLREVFDRLGASPSTIRFHFASAWVGMQFLPTYLRHVPPVDFLERLRAADRTLWMAATYYLSRSFGERPINFGPADRQKRLFSETWPQPRRELVRGYLVEHGRLVQQ